MREHAVLLWVLWEYGRSVWALCNYVGFMGCLRNSQWQCLMIILILGTFAKAIYILHNPPFMLKIPILHFWATCGAIWKAIVIYTDSTERRDRVKCYWTSQYICIQPTQASQVIGVWGRLHGGPVSIRFLSVRTLTRLSFCVVLTEWWEVWCEKCLCLLSHIHTL